MSKLGKYMPIPLAVAFAAIFLPWFKEVHSRYPGTPDVVRYVAGYQRFSGIVVMGLVILIMGIRLLRSMLIQNRIREVTGFFLWLAILICCTDMLYVTFFNMGTFMAPDFGIISCIAFSVAALILNKKRD